MTSHYLIGFSDLVDLWVIKKNLWSFAHVVNRRDHVNRARNADHAARTCERIICSIVTITRSYDYQTWQTIFFGGEKFTRCVKACGPFILIVLFGCWLAGHSDHKEITCITPFIRVYQDGASQVWNFTKVSFCFLLSMTKWTKENYMNGRRIKWTFHLKTT